MHLAIRRSTYEGFFGTNYYVLDALLEPRDDAERTLLLQHLTHIVVFDSQNREAFKESIQQHLEATKEQADWLAPLNEALWSVATTTYHLGAAALYALFGSFSTQLTVQNLLDGAQFESDNFNEVNVAEGIIIESIGVLKTYVEYLERFDERDDLFEA
jgi:hypothetical protein